MLTLSVTLGPFLELSSHSPKAKRVTTNKINLKDIFPNKGPATNELMTFSFNRFAFYK